MDKQQRGYLQVTGAAALWGMLVIFYHNLVGLDGLTPLEVSFFRAALSALILGVALALRQRALLRIQRRDALLFLGFGTLGWRSFSSSTFMPSA